MFHPQPLHQLPSLGIGGDASAAPFWHTLGNRLAIAWQYYGNRSVFLAIAFLSHCRHTKMYAFPIGRRIPHPAQVPLLLY